MSERRNYRILNYHIYSTFFTRLVGSNGKQWGGRKKLLNHFFLKKLIENLIDLILPKFQINKYYYLCKII